MISVKPRTDVRGVLSSWETVDMKSVFMRSISFSDVISLIRMTEPIPFSTVPVRIYNVFMDSCCHCLADPVACESYLRCKYLAWRISCSFQRALPDHQAEQPSHLLPFISVSLRSNMAESAGLTR